MKEYVEEGASAVSLEVIKPLPPDFALLIGDIVHNLRAALDHLAVGIVQAAAGKASNYVGFPVDESRDQAIKTRHKEIKEHSPDVFALIVDEIKPFKAPDGDGFIWGLNKLDIADKHRFIIPVARVTAIHDVNAVADNGLRLISCGLIVEGDGIVRGFRTKGKFKIESYGKPSFDIFFGDAEVFAGEPIIPTLLQLGQATARVVDILHAHFFGETFDQRHSSRS